MNIDLDNNFIIGPDETSRLRNIENKLLESFIELGFKEAIFPKHFSSSMQEELSNLSPRLTEEWESELFYLFKKSSTDPELVDSGFRLCHWQCEPFYFYLKSLGNITDDILLLDRSGWSFRNESIVEEFRYSAFLRIEVTWARDKSDVDMIAEISSIVGSILRNLKLQYRVVEKPSEVKSSREKSVVDIEVKTVKGWVEVCGIHLHGQLFLNGLGIHNSSYETGCAGISLSRIFELSNR